MISVTVPGETGGGKFQIPKPKFQTNSKFPSSQIPKSRDAVAGRFGLHRPERQGGTVIPATVGEEKIARMLWNSR